MTRTATHEHKCSCGGMCALCRQKRTGSRRELAEAAHARHADPGRPPADFRFGKVSVSAGRELANAPADPFASLGGPLSPRSSVPDLFPRSSTLPYREATELQECIRITGDAEQCRRTVLGTCTPGPSRDLTVQPVFFRNAAADPAPTGGSWSRRMSEARVIWGKLGVTFTESSAVMLTDAANKTAGTTAAERSAIRGLHDGPGVEVFLVDNDIAQGGGAAGVPVGGGAGSKIVLSDRGTSGTLLAHELGHALGLGHPPGGADPGTIMAPSSSHSAENPRRNTMENLRRITFPQGTGITCIDPDT